MKRQILFLSLGLTLSLGVGLLWLSEGNTAQAENMPNPEHPFATLNQKAKNARAGNRADVDDLVNEAAHISGLENEPAGFMTDSIKDRIGRNESRYRSGQADGIPEGKIVRTVNGLAKKLNLPDYARTNAYEVRKLRLSLLPSFPQLIGQKTQSSQPLTVGAKLDSQMSPAEAVFVLAMMFQQKQYNDEYQVTNSEQLSKWKETHDHHPKKPKKSDSQDSISARSREMKTALESGADSLSTSDALKLSDITLNTLGIEQ
jgi:hypothetical protein